MFGEKKLLRDGTEGQAVVLEADYRSDGMGSTHHIYRVQLRVRFDDGSTGEFHTKLDRGKVGECRQADIVPVRYDASDHSKVVVDVPALEAEFQRTQAKAEADRASRIARSEARLAQGDAPRSASPSPLAEDIPAGGNTAAAIDFLKSAMNEISSSGAAQDSVEERLTRLQNLRDRGLLSSEEFEAQRQRVLQSL